MPSTEGTGSAEHSWHAFLRRYLSVTGLLNLIWEIAQLPLYTLWHEQSAQTIVFSVLHCGIGDVLIAALALLSAVLIFGNSAWPRRRYLSVASGTIAAGLIYTLYSEWMNVAVRKSWAYSDAMPQAFGIGVSPMLQWLIVPALVFWRLKRI